MVSVLAVPQCGQVKVESRINALSCIGVTQAEQYKPDQQPDRGQAASRRLGANAVGGAESGCLALAPQQNGPAHKAGGSEREQNWTVRRRKDSDAVEPSRPEAKGGKDKGQAAA